MPSHNLFYLHSENGDRHRDRGGGKEKERKKKKA